MNVKELLEAVHELTPEQLKEIEDVIASAGPKVAALVVTAVGKLYGVSSLGKLRANNPGVPIDEQGRLMQCSSCKTIHDIHQDLGSGGPYRCTSYDCVVF